MDILKEKVKRFIHKPIIIGSNTSIRDAAKVMKDNNVTSLIVKDDDYGMVTERDILYKVVAEGIDINSSIDTIASKPLITIDADSRVEEAIALMSKHNVRRLAIIENDDIIGILTQMSIVGNLKVHDLPIAMIDIPKGVLCPYCQSIFESKEELSKHIDKIHIGLGLLEGNIRRLNE